MMTSEPETRRSKMPRGLVLALFLLSHQASAFAPSGVSGPSPSLRSGRGRALHKVHVTQTSSSSLSTSTSYWPPLSGEKYEDKPSNLFGGAFGEGAAFTSDDAVRLQKSKVASFGNTDAELNEIRFPLGSGDSSSSSAPSGRSYWPGGDWQGESSKVKKNTRLLFRIIPLNALTVTFSELITSIYSFLHAIMFFRHH